MVEDELHGLGVCSIEETGNDMTYVSLAPARQLLGDVRFWER